MKKPWSITTTLRNPERLRNFLIVLKELENSEWTLENQIKYQIFHIKESKFYIIANNLFRLNLCQPPASFGGVKIRGYYVQLRKIN